MFKIKKVELKKVSILYKCILYKCYKYKEIHILRKAQIGNTKKSE